VRLARSPRGEKFHTAGRAHTALVKHAPVHVPHGEVGAAPRAPVHGSGSSIAGPDPASGVAHSVAALCSASTPAHTATHTRTHPHTLHRLDGYDWMILPVVKACEYLTLRLSVGEGTSEGLAWELEQLIRQGRPEQIVICLGHETVPRLPGKPDPTAPYHEFFERFNHLFPKGLPVQPYDSTFIASPRLEASAVPRATHPQRRIHLTPPASSSKAGPLPAILVLTKSRTHAWCQVMGSPLDTTQ
jgi:hypothetical protein